MQTGDAVIASGVPRVLQSSASLAPELEADFSPAPRPGGPDQGGVPAQGSSGPTDSWEDRRRFVVAKALVLRRPAQLLSCGSPTSTGPFRRRHPHPHPCRKVPVEQLPPSGNPSLPVSDGSDRDYRVEMGLSSVGGAGFPGLLRIRPGLSPLQIPASRSLISSFPFSLESPPAAAPPLLALFETAYSDSALSALQESHHCPSSTRRASSKAAHVSDGALKPSP